MRTIKLAVLSILFAACSDSPGAGVDAPPPPPIPDGNTNIAPSLTSFTASPAAAQPGSPTSITWRWTYLAAPNPEPTCSIDNGVGTVTNGLSTTVTLTNITTYTLTCTNVHGSASRPLVVTTGTPSAPSIGSSISASPFQVPAGIPTQVTWSWSVFSPGNPPPVCSINNGVGTVTNGQTTTITINSSTFYTLTCTNIAGSDTATTTISTFNAVAPMISTFTTSPSTVSAGVSTSVQFNWTYAINPSPVPTCTINNGIGTTSPGQVRTVNQNATATYTLSCTNAAGTDTEMVTITTP